MMANDELGVMWRHMELLHQTVAELIELEGRALGAQRPPAAGVPPMLRPSPAIDEVLEQLAELRERLRPGQEEAARFATTEKRRWEEIDVERLNIVEPDGTLRLAISDSTRAPDPVVDGKTLTGARQGANAAGVIFYNDMGDECGGLVFGGRRQGEGYAAEAGLLFDQFRQDQVLGLMHGDENGKRWAGLWVWDRPDAPMMERRERWEAIRQMPKGAEQRDAAQALGPDEIHRVFVGKTEERAAVVYLYDAQRRVRLRLTVEADGASAIEFLDAAGTVTHRLPDMGLVGEGRATS